MFRVAALLLLCLPCLVHAQVITLPEVINSDGKKFVIIEPKFDKEPKGVAFEILGLKRAPEAVTFGKTALVATPDPDDEITIVVAAVFEGYILKTKSTTVRKSTPAGGGGGTTTPNTNPPPTGDRDIPAGVTGIQAIMVVDINAVPADLAPLSLQGNSIAAKLASIQGKWYFRNSTDSLLDFVRPKIQGKSLPVLVVLGPGNKILAAESFVPTGDAAATAKRVITTIANAIK